MPSRFLLTIASSLESTMEANQRKRCSLSRSAASISLDLEKIRTLFTCLARPRRGPTLGDTIAPVIVEGTSMHPKRPPPNPGSLSLPNKLIYRACDLSYRIRLRQKTTAFGQVALGDLCMSRSCNNLDGRPATFDEMSELKSVHRSRHLDIGEY